MSNFAGTVVNPGSGGAKIASDTFTQGADTVTIVYSGLAFGTLGGGSYQAIDATHGMPVNVVAGSITIGAGSAVIGHVVVDSGNVAISGTVAVTQSGAWSLAAHQSTNVDQLNGSAIDTNSGNKSAGTQRVVLATDQPQLTNALKVDGSAITQPVSAVSLPLPAGAATSAKQPALGTPGTASTDVLSVQGIAGMTALKVDGSGVTQPISGTVTVGNSTLAVTQSGNWSLAAHQSTNVDQLNGNSVDTNSGNKSAGTLRVVVATDQPQLTNALKVDGSGVTQPVSIAGNQAVNIAQVNGTASSANEGSSDAGTQRIAIGTDDNFSTDSRWSSGDTNLHTVKASAGRIFRIEVTNNGSGAVYLRIYNKASNPAPASDTPVRRYIIPGNTAGAGAIFDFLKGRYFSTGIAYDVTGGAGDTDTTAIAANQCAINVDYK
jgi:hypothetical protein